ncbi:MAG: hypothetical protein CMJ48_01410 [Planctomycetaceae bacterium]|nr:hypothetical protein [Planctomycetaceae bacterium]
MAPRSKSSPQSVALHRGLGARVLSAVFRPKQLLLLAVAVLGVVLIPTLLRSLPDLRDRPEYRLKAMDIVVSDLPLWVPQDLVERAVRSAGLAGELSVMDANVVEEVAEAFRLQPWVARVDAVVKSVPARIEVELTFRRPVAMVQVENGMYPVDGEGILLPPTDFSVADTQQFPLIMNVRSTPQGPAGTNWGDAAVLGAASLAEQLSSEWNDLRLDAIWVTPHSNENANIDDLTFELISPGGSHILWGRFPDTKHPGELTVEQKIGRLRKVLSERGSFDSPNGPYEIDIRHWLEISITQLSATERIGSRR